MKKFLVILLLVIFTLPIYATNWKEIYPKIYIDYDSWDYSNGLTTVWVKSLNPGNWDLMDNKKVWYSLDRIQFDCTQKFYSFKFISSYDLKGSVIDSVTVQYPKWNIIPPDTVIDMKYRAVCGR